MEQEYLTTPFEAKRITNKEIKAGLVVAENFFISDISDLDKLSNFIMDCKTIVDIGSGYGLLISSLAKLNKDKKFLGIDTIYYKQTGFPIPERLKNLKFKFHGIEAMAHADKRGFKIKKFDCVICSWMPMGSDWRENLAKISNKKVILILSKDFNTGILDTYSGMEKFGFKLIRRAWTSSDSLIQLWERQMDKKEFNSKELKRGKNDNKKN